MLTRGLLAFRGRARSCYVRDTSTLGTHNDTAATGSGQRQGQALAWHGNALTRELLASQGRSVAVPRSQNIGDTGPRHDAAAWNGDGGERVTTTRWAPAHKGVGGP